MRYILLIILVCFSCSSKKQILLLQDSSKSSNYNIEYQDIKIKTDDILKISISFQSPELNELFSFSDKLSNGDLQSYMINGFHVNSEGYISLPVIGDIFVHDNTIIQASDLISKSLTSQGFLNAVVDVKILNSYFTILGEVKSPGRYNFLENNINIFQAIGMAGDLTINGKRDDIKIIRIVNKNTSVNTLDLTSSFILNSENYQIFPGDIIIINPNNARVKNAGIIGNSGNLLSVLSFILTSLILITSNN